MFVGFVASVTGAFFISLGLICLSTRINPYLHSLVREELKRAQTDSSIRFLRQVSLDRIETIFGIFLLLSGLVVHLCQGVKRLLVLIPLLIVSIYFLQLSIISGTGMDLILAYVVVLASILMILFYDCAMLDELEIK